MRYKFSISYRTPASPVKTEDWRPGPRCLQRSQELPGTRLQIISLDNLHQVTKTAVLKQEDGLYFLPELLFDFRLQRYRLQRLPSCIKKVILWTGGRFSQYICLDLSQGLFCRGVRKPMPRPGGRRDSMPLVGLSGNFARLLTVSGEAIG